MSTTRPANIPAGSGESRDTRHVRWYQWTVLVVSIVIFFGCIISPPNLMDDVDAVQGQIGRNMLDSGDWVTARLDGIKNLEKPPFIYWCIAISEAIFGPRDWATRIPVALATVLLCWLTFRMGWWAFGARAGFYAGLALSTSIGLWLFTRIQIADVMVTGSIALALWAMLRALDPEEPRARLWSAIMAAAIGLGFLLKGLIAFVFPVAAAGVYLAITRELFQLATWRRLHLLTGTLIALAIAAPWHILASLQNPPYLDLTMKPGIEYRGFFWFYFLNEHLFRFLNIRLPRDYNTVPRFAFWWFHLIWIFPFSAFFPALGKLSYRPVDRAGRVRLLCLCWIGAVMIFFTFSTTQEYYSMPCYPAIVLLLGAALTTESAAKFVRGGQVALAVVCSLACAAATGLLVTVWNLPAPGDISRALTQHPEAYTLSLGHMGDLTIASFAYLKLPLAMAAAAFLIGARSAWRRSNVGIVVMMVLFFHAARLALIVFDPYMGSRPLAEALNRAPHGKLILDNQYFAFSSVVFYAEAYQHEKIYLLNGRVTNLEYGANEAGAPTDVFLDDQQFRERWLSGERYYVCVEKPQVPRFQSLVGQERLHTLVESGGKYVFTNQ